MIHRQSPILVAFSLCWVLSSTLCSLDGLARGRKEDNQAKANNAAPSKKEPQWQSAFIKAQKSYRSGKLRECAQALDEAFALAQTLKDSDKAEAYFQIGEQYLKIGQEQKALGPIEDALELRKRAYGEKSINVANALDALSMVKAKSGDIAQAAALSEEAHDIYKKLGSKEDKDYAIFLANYAFILGQKKKFAEAEASYKQAIEINKRLSGPMDLEVAKSTLNLGLLLMDQKKFKESEQELRQALNIMEEKVPMAHPLFKTCLQSLRLLYKKEVAEALSADSNAFRTDVVRPLSNLASILKSEGNFASAADTYAQVLSIDKKLLASGDKQLASTMEQYADCLRKLNRVAEASDLEKSAQEIRTGNSINAGANNNSNNSF